MFNPHLRPVDVSTDRYGGSTLSTLGSQFFIESPGDAIVDKEALLLQFPQGLTGDKGEGAFGLVDGTVGRDVPTEGCTVFYDGTGDFVCRLLTGDDQGVAQPTVGQRP